MKLKTFLLSIVASVFLAAAPDVMAEDLVILHTNDTHSTIDPDSHGVGGVLQRKAIIDSVRKTEKNVLLVDAGDIVQGTLYYKFFKGDVEYPVMNQLGYDIRVLGNHEFDNGLDELAHYYKDVKGARLSANYDFSATPLRGMFEPYIIKKIGGKRIGFLGINLDPDGLISQENYKGMGFKDIISTANETAAYLRHKKKCDLVVMVSHIGVDDDPGRTNDYDVARASRDIDIIIGGHSHTVIQPDNNGSYPSLVDNAAGRPVLVVQTGRYGANLGYIKIDLSKLAFETPADYDYELIPVTDRFPDSKLDKGLKALIAPYKHVVDSVNARVIAWSLYDLPADRKAGGYANFAGDFASHYARGKIDSLRRAGMDIPPLDFALMNVGGIRHGMPKGAVTEGQILSTFPFSNHLVIARVKGSDFIEAMRVAAKRGGEAVSEEVVVLTDSAGTQVKSVLLNLEEMDPDREYVYATIDYLFWGNDDLKSLANSKLIWRDEFEVSVPILRYVEHMGRLGLPIAPDLTPRFLKYHPLP